MKIVYPDYYPAFSCIADRCNHSCCIGWEIDIDQDALTRFQSAEGPMGQRLKENISLEGEPHFILGEDERCPFLNEKGLCDLILYGGEEILCQICTDHPRFRNFLPGRTEIGVGLCCEAAGQLILSRKQPVKLCSDGTEGETDPEAEALFSCVKRLFISHRIEPVLSRKEQTPYWSDSKAGCRIFLLLSGRKFIWTWNGWKKIGPAFWKTCGIMAVL